jgi:outer membrane protein, multidrug efflux system
LARARAGHYPKAMMRVVRALPFMLLLAAPPAAAQQQPIANPESVNLPPPITVDDPDLRPLPPAKRVVSSWDEITVYLRARSADIRVAQDEVGRAEAQAREALAGVLGTINATGVYTHYITQGSFQLTGAGGFNSFQDIITGNVVGTLPIIAPRAWNAIPMANANTSVMRASLDDTKRTIATNVANAAVTVVTDERIADLNRVGLRQSLERLELAKRKTSLGAGTGLDVIRAQQDVETARSTLVTGDETARQAREAFGISIGVAEDVSVAGDLSFEAITRQVISQCKPAPSVEERPDIIAARERVRFAKLATWDIKTQFFPTLTLQSTIATTSLPVTPATTWNIQGVLTWLIWDGGVRYGQLRDNNLQLLEAQDKLDAARRTAIIQVVQADRGVSVAEQTRDVSKRARDLAAEVDRLTRQGFMTGLYTSLDLVTAATALRQAEINLALADFGVIKAKILAVLTLATCPL